MDIRIRPYTDSDFAAVTEIWLTSGQSTGVPAPVTLEELRVRWPEELAKGWSVYVAERNNEIAGFVGLKDRRLEQIFVAPRYQNRGIGKVLLDFVKARMPEGFALDTALDSRAPSFYDREGLERGEVGIHPRWGHRTLIYYWRPSADAP